MRDKRLTPSLKEEIFSFKASKSDILWTIEIWNKLKARGFTTEEILKILNLEEDYKFWERIVNERKSNPKVSS